MHGIKYNRGTIGPCVLGHYGNIIALAPNFQLLHGGGSVTNLTSLGGDDIINIETVDGNLSVDSGEGYDTVRVGSTAGGLGQTNRLIDALDGNTNSLLGRVTIEGGEITPTLKLKRKAINQKYKDLVDAMY